jgi:hypothetical protein
MCLRSELENGMVVAYLLLGGFNAVLYNITHYRVIQITSSTATPVIGDDDYHSLTVSLALPLA